MKTVESIKSDWKWETSEGNRELDRLLDRQLTFRDKFEWLEEAETLTLRLRANRNPITRRRHLAAELNGESRSVGNL